MKIRVLNSDVFNNLVVFIGRVIKGNFSHYTLI